MVPLFFQVILLESATKAGARLVIPSLATPTGSLIAGIIMSRWGRLIGLMRIGAVLMFVGNCLLSSLKFVDASWKYFVFIFPANLGQGIIYPATLFTSLASFEHDGETSTSASFKGVFTNSIFRRSRRFHVDHLPDSITWWSLGCVNHVCHCANHARLPSSGGLGRDT